MSITKDNRFSVQLSNPSVNIIRDAKAHLNYIPTPNSKQVFSQIVNNYKTGTRSFNIVGAFGTGKSAFLLALEKNFNREQTYFSDRPFLQVKSFDVLRMVGEHASFIDIISEKIRIDKRKKRPKDILVALKERYSQLARKGQGLMIVVDEFGKILEHAAKNHPESELYFIQQLAEFVNDTEREIIFITTLHQDFNEYARDLTKLQMNEWDKVRGRLKEVTFNEPVEQLLFLAAERLEVLSIGKKNRDFVKLFQTIEKSKAFPLKDYLSETYAEKLLPFDILSAAVLTISLQRYGQNERSLFSFINSKDPLGLNNYDQKLNPYYNLNCVYDYLMQNFYSLLTTRYNSDYTQWAGIRSAIERVEGAIQDRLVDTVKIVKVIGLLNIFSSAAIKMDIEFLNAYCGITLGIKDVDNILKSLQGLRIVRYVKHSQRFILFEGTDLDIEMAINDAGELVEKVTNVVHHLNKYFDFPYVSAKAVQYEHGTPRFFAFKLSEAPIQDFPEGEIDGYVNLIFSDTIREQDIVNASKHAKHAVLIGWYKNNTEIRKLLFEIDKIKKVKDNHFEDKVALRELESILQHQIRLLNHYVIDSLYRESSYLKWFYKGRECSVKDRKSFNRLLSTICRQVYSRTPSYKNEMVNKTRLSSPIQAARKSFIKALVDNWDKRDLGFEDSKFPPEKTIYLSLLRETGIHRYEKGGYVLGEPTNENAGLSHLWEECTRFLQSTYAGKRNLQELVDIFLARPYKLKRGFIEYWLPVFLFSSRDDFALFGRNGYIPFLTHENLELVIKDPKDYEVKAFHIEGVRLNLFNRYRVLLSLSTQEKLTNTVFIDTIRPFLTFYKKLPEYARNTNELEKRTLALRNAIATAKDPEECFFVQFPKAMGYDINELNKDPKLLKEYSKVFEESLKEIRECYSELLERVADFIIKDILGGNEEFPAYRTSLQNRYRHLKKYLLLPHQKAFHQRLYSEAPDKTAWLNSITQACLDKPLEAINDTEEQILYEKLRDLCHELDNLTDITESGFDVEKEIVFKFEITSFVEGLKKNLVRLPKTKTRQLIQLQSVVKAKLTEDRQLNIATLVKMLEELLENEN